MTKLVITTAGNPAAVQNLERSVRNGVDAERLLQEPAVAGSAELLRAHAGDHRIRMWGSVSGEDDRHRTTWEKVDAGDWIAFYTEGRFRLAGRVYHTLDSANLTDAVWEPDPGTGSYRLLTFLDSLTEISLSTADMSAALGYESGYIYRGFLVPSTTAQEHLADRYGSVENFLFGLRRELEDVFQLAAPGDPSAYLDALSSLKDATALERALGALAEHLRTRTPESITTTANRVRRDQHLVNALKRAYEGRCQVCGFTFLTRQDVPYCEVAHLTPLASRLPGIDSPDNVVILCANCHRQLDYGSLEIYWDDRAAAAMARQGSETPQPLALNFHIHRNWAPANDWRGKVTGVSEDQLTERPIGTLRCVE